MTSPPTPSSSLNPPKEVRRSPVRPPSPLRNTFIADTSTGINPEDIVSEDEDDEEDDDEHDQRRWNERSLSPSSSVSNLAASLKERVGNFLGSMTSRSPLLSDAEIEAEAERARDRSRREAENILSQEAAEERERMRVEERVLALIGSQSGNDSVPNTPHARGGKMTNPPSPSQSHKDKDKDGSSWWTAAKNRLTPTKDLTPAQQIVQETKTREKESKKGKRKEKEKEEPRYSDPAALVPPQYRRPVTGSPTSPTPSRPTGLNMAPNLTPSPMRSGESSPSREAPPLYAQFNNQGSLDIPGTLLAIAKRFEKLEKWTVGHVRALEERMNDVERWLVEKEKEREKEKEEGEDVNSDARRDGAVASPDLQDMRDGMTELQGRVTELGREMARLATSPSFLSSGPRAQQPGPISHAPSTSSTIAVPSGDDSPGPGPTGTDAALLLRSPMTPSVHAAHSRFSSVSTARESTSPPPLLGPSRIVSGTRLPYPTGDYATPTESAGYSPSQSSSSPSSSTRPSTRPLSVASAKSSVSGTVGLGISGTSLQSGSLSSGTPPVPATLMTPTASGRSLPAPPPQAKQNPSASADARRNSVSPTPTPRKRYTVALGEPIMSPLEMGEPQQLPLGHIGTAFFSTLDGDGASESRSRAEEDSEDGETSGDGQENDSDKEKDGKSWRSDEAEEAVFDQDTIGKSAAARFVTATATATGGSHSGGGGSSSSVPSSGSKRRIRTQSAYIGSGSGSGSSMTGLHFPTDSGSTSDAGGSSARSMRVLQTPPLRPRTWSRSSSSDRHMHMHHGGGGGGGAGGSNAAVNLAAGGGEPFVDPLVLRRREKDGRKGVRPMAGPGRKVPVGQLVAFFDKEKGR